MTSKGKKRTAFMQRGKKRTENGTSRRKIGSLRLWIAAQQVEAREWLRDFRIVPGHDRTDRQKTWAANMTGRLAVLAQMDAILAGEVEIPEPDLPAEPDSEDEAMQRQDLAEEDEQDG